MRKQKLWNPFLSGLLFTGALVITPLFGAMLAGIPPAPYLKFPPRTIAVEHPSFSWFAFILILLFVVLTTWPFFRRLARGIWIPDHQKSAHSFPFWGWIALTGLHLFWILAWTRFPWFEAFQRHTFFPLWFCFIMVLNATTYRLTGRCLMMNQPLYFTLLFPVSALFWWIFEYLNLFVNNWYYTGMGELSDLQYFLEASLAFSTVLPAVMSVRYLLLQIPVFSKEYDNFSAMPWLASRRFWGVTGLVSILGLAGTGWKPEYMFPLLWLVPGLLWVAFQIWRGTINPILEGAAKGNLTLLWASAAAGLFCGFFWEMWNLYSQAKWIYAIPGAGRFYLFGMPLLGYAGYLPFGVICALVSHSLFESLYRGKEKGNILPN